MNYKRPKRGGSAVQDARASASGTGPRPRNGERLTGLVVVRWCKKEVPTPFEEEPVDREGSPGSYILTLIMKDYHPASSYISG